MLKVRSKVLVGLLTLGVVVAGLSLQNSSASFASFLSRNPSNAAFSNKKVLTEASHSTSPSVVVRAAKQSGSSSTVANRPTKTGPDSASPMDRPSAEELKRFPGSTVRQSAQVSGPGPNQTTHVRILETDFKYPNLRTEEVVDTATGQVILREEMVANFTQSPLPTEFFSKK